MKISARRYSMTRPLPGTSGTKLGDCLIIMLYTDLSAVHSTWVRALDIIVYRANRRCLCSQPSSTVHTCRMKKFINRNGITCVNHNFITLFEACSEKAAAGTVNSAPLADFRMPRHLFIVANHHAPLTQVLSNLIVFLPEDFS